MYEILVLFLFARALADKRLTIANGCDRDPIWIAHEFNGQVGPDPQDIKINPGENVQLSTVAGQNPRFWPKMGCDASGGNCTIGDSGGPKESCVIHGPKGDDYSHCAPPVDSKLEATWGAGAAPDILDMSAVDGYSLPFKLETSGGSCTRTPSVGKVVPFAKMDCSGLVFGQCPTAETINGKSMNLQAISPKTGKQVGCYSPCMRLVDDKWQAHPVAADSPEAAPYCCAGSFVAPDKCHDGPMPKSQYLREIRKACPFAYTYAYDDMIATIACSTSTEYTLTFYCPGGPPNPPPPPTPEPPLPPPTPPPPSPPPTPPAPVPHCSVGDSVTCPGVSATCAGDQCCPDGSTCPSAHNDFAGCAKAKIVDCTRSIVV